MFRASIVPLLVAIGVLHFAGCSRNSETNGESSAEKKITAEKETTKAIRISRIEDSARVAGQLVDSDVSVYRWEHGISEGWVRFEGGAQKMPLALDKIIYDELQTAEGNKAPEASRFAGTVIVTRKRLNPVLYKDPDFDWYECTIHLESSWKVLNKSERSHRSVYMEGRIKHPKKPPPNTAAKPPLSKEPPSPTFGAPFYASRIDGNNIQFAIGPHSQGEEAVWLELKIVDPTTPETP